MVVGLSDDQWREFGSTLRAVHDSGLGGHLRGRIPAETFALPSAALVRQLLALVEGEGTSLESPAATRFGGFWRENAGQIRLVLARAEGLGVSLRRGPSISSRATPISTPPTSSWGRRAASGWSTGTVRSLLLGSATCSSLSARG